MDNRNKIQGIVTAILTPLDNQGKTNTTFLQEHIRMLENDGSNAILVCGTTGEGPSFSVVERESILEAAIDAAGRMEVIAQTGCASLEDTITLTRHAFKHGLKKATILPPYFFKGISDEGLFAYYRQIIERAIPENGKLILYHIPQVTQVPISHELIDRLLSDYGEQIGGIKDSAGELSHVIGLCQRFPQLPVFTGNDQLILEALRAGAIGCVTGVVNVFASMAAEIFKSFYSERNDPENCQLQFTKVWEILHRYQPYTSLLKGLVAQRYQNSDWMNVRPPLDPISSIQLKRMIAELRSLHLPEAYSWIDQPLFINRANKRNAL
jgi:4-hydroxy-tetrahydrodipicolinate synthase